MGDDNDGAKKQMEITAEQIRTALNARDVDEAVKNISSTPLSGVVTPTVTSLSLMGRDEHLAKIDKTIKKLESSVENLRHMISTNAKSFEEMNTKYQEFRTTVEDPATALNGFKAAILEELKLKEARALWMSRAKSARVAYSLSWVILAGLLIVAPGIAIWNSTAIFGFFRAIGEAALVDLPANATETAILIAAISRLVLITLPVALYIWLIRIVVRFNMRSLLLMDDANQRNTMLETYLHLVEQDDGVKADRPLILEALFRRTPGHGAETIEPPNLADVLKLGSKPSAAG
ncbi:DUF6161 domain-containing protein [Aquamicrobium terrae]